MKKFPKSKKILIVIAVLVMILVIFTAIILMGTGFNKALINNVAAVTSFNEAELSEINGISTFTKGENEFRILQLTDLHIGNGILSKNADSMAIETIIELINFSQPNLIIITGDMIYPFPFSSGTNNNLRAAKVVGTLMESFKIPWTFVYGNHEAESYASASKEKLSDYFESLEYCLFKRGPENLTGMGNYIININNPDSTLNTSLVFLDSNMYIKGEGMRAYDKVHDDQIEWYKNQINTLSEGRQEKVQSLMFMHIPFDEYATVWDLYKQGSSEVEYHYGEQRENVCHPVVSSNIFNEIVELGSTKGIFCGHDHINDYSITYRGVRLTYGKSIDYLAYKDIENKTEQRGGTMIEISADSSFAVTPITYQNLM